jgi:L-malate glycosyltransferase
LRIHQLVPRLDAGDAIGNQAMAIHELLLAWGFKADIFAYDMDDFGRQFASFDSAYREFMHCEEDLLIYHYGLYCDNYRLFVESRNRKVLIYHNITPPEFYECFYPEAAHLCRLGKALLPQLSVADLALGDSDFNRREMVAAGFPQEKTGVLPINPPLDKLDGVEADEAFLRQLDDGKVNLLFVGRVVPNKRVEDIVKLFYCYHRGINARSRLIVAGSLLNTYYSALLAMTQRMGIQDRVHFLGKISEPRLKSCYMGSHYYVSMSEHEGFCVPLLEAFYFDLPVLAYCAGAVPETMGDAGVVFDQKDYGLLAELVDRLERDAFLRERMLQAQRRRLEDFDSSLFEASLRRALGGLLELAEPERVAAAAGGG